MHSLLRTTTASAALAAALTVSPVALLAQEAATDDTAAQGAATGTAEDTTLAQEGTAAEGADAATGTELAQEGDAAATTGADTEVAADDATTGAATDDATVTAEEGTAAEPAEGTQTETAQGTEAPDAAGDTAIAQDDAAAAGEDAATDTAGTQDTQTAAGDVPAEPNEQMAAVLDKHAELGARPIEELSVEEARTQPSPADAVMAVMEEQGIEMPAELAAIATRDITYPAADGSEQPLRVYTPEGEGPFPLIVYYHGGGWVIADIDTYDASARALAAGAQAVVVSVEYRHAPEAPFPAQHEDANAAYSWIVENSGSLNADAERLAVAGESAGGNLAINVAINARDAQLTQPDHMLLVYPIAGNDMETASYQSYAEAKPLSRADMMWFVEHVFEDASQAADPRINLVGRDDLAGLPPATIINAEIDPLTTEGVALGSLLEEAGVEVSQMTYPGVTHEFFGMGAVVPEAKQAEDMAVAELRAAFGADASVPVTDVETTAAEGTDAAATGDAAATDADAATQLEGTTEPMEGEAATDAGD